MKRTIHKKDSNNRVKWIHIRLSPDEYNIIVKRKMNSTCRNLSIYIRSIIFDHPIVATFRNISQDEIVEQIVVLNRELNSIGNNLNQTVKRLHTLREGEVVGWTARYASESQ
ncbi:plasmid mobilization protein [Flavobacterium suaedae]|uniref:plasmid mobilization protein n=1 Tax=Flavobacterium suaedae TaxID=1767027 RepID=UPI00166BE3EF|nr:plasmid mobilization relaxosome protein MobC [Flavobacterium suaedae]